MTLQYQKHDPWREGIINCTLKENWVQLKFFVVQIELKYQFLTEGDNIEV